jgi:hypothetical protein
MTKLLIDECLSAELALMARERGHHLATHVSWIGKAGWKDWELKEILLAQDWVLVTRNCKDFRGPKRAPGSKGAFADVSLHAGLVCIHGPTGMDLGLRRLLFAEALEELDRDSDLTNQVLEVSRSEAGTEAELVRYHMPPLSMDPA